MLFSVKSLLRSVSSPVLNILHEVEVSSKNVSLLPRQTFPLPQELQQLHLAPVALLTKTVAVEVEDSEAGLALSPGQVEPDYSARQLRLRFLRVSLHGLERNEEWVQRELGGYLHSPDLSSRLPPQQRDRTPEQETPRTGNPLDV